MLFVNIVPCGLSTTLTDPGIVMTYDMFSMNYRVGWSLPP